MVKILHLLLCDILWSDPIPQGRQGNWSGGSFAIKKKETREPAYMQIYSTPFMEVLIFTVPPCTETAEKAEMRTKAMIWAAWGDVAAPSPIDRSIPPRSRPLVLVLIKVYYCIYHTTPRESLGWDHSFHIYDPLIKTTLQWFTRASDVDSSTLRATFSLFGVGDAVRL
jgi:hypothetical protein